MQPILSIAQMRAFDERMIQETGIPSLVLMENAARGALRAMEDWFTGPMTKILIYCGTGNNGGDGIALGRMLEERTDVDYEIVIIGETSKFSLDARSQYSLLSKLLDVNDIQSVGRSRGAPSARPDIVVDALLGTGSSGPLREPILQAVRLMNTHRANGAKVLALDLPTGLDGDTGLFEINENGEALVVHADRTVSLGASKIGFFQNNATDVLGQVVVAPLGISPSFTSGSDRDFFVEAIDVARDFPIKLRKANKFTQGRLLSLVGSRGMTGAAMMSSLAAFRAGCGLVNIAISSAERALIASALPEVLIHGIEENEDGGPSLAAFDTVLHLAENSQAVLIGCGLRPVDDTVELVQRLIRECDRPMVIDGGALGALAEDVQVLRDRRAPTILTPHVGEMARLVGATWEDVEEHRLEIARQFAIEFGVTIVMKGAPTFTLASDGTAFINSTGNPGLATAGTGDVLAGMIAGLMARIGERPTEASTIAVYVHGLAADLAAQALSVNAMIATDVIRYIPNALRALGLA